MEEINAINKLYESSDNKDQMVRNIINSRRAINSFLKAMSSLLLELYTKTMESHDAWVSNGSNKSTPMNSYMTTKEYENTFEKFKGQLESFKKGGYFKLVGNPASYCDEIVSYFKPSSIMSVGTFGLGKNKELLTKICNLFYKYVQHTSNLIQYFDYFNDNKKSMTGGLFGRSPPPSSVITYFKSWMNSLTRMMSFYDEDIKYTNVLERELLKKPPVRTQTAGHKVRNTSKNIKTRRRRRK